MNMKRIYKIVTALSVILSFTGGAFADNSDYSGTVVSMQIDNPIMEVNGESAEIDPGNGTSPVIVNSRTLVPIRAIIEEFGGSVNWDEKSRSVSLGMNGDIVLLTIDSTTAYYNNVQKTLDTAPVIIGGRTMLPIRFVAESFDLTVGWDGYKRTVTVVKGKDYDADYKFSIHDVPDYFGNPYIELNNNITVFEKEFFDFKPFEYYSELDYLGRCGICVASVSDEIMPTEERGSVSSVHPTGWQSVKYDIVSGKYLYNRCHLIGFQLTGENANKNNLITGTRYLNTEGMLPFEEMVDNYVEETGNRVLYRATPVFEGDNLLADGVHLEGYSVEDNGEKVCFNVYCYNVQPGININYTDGTSELATFEEFVPENGTYVLNTKSMKIHFPDCTTVVKMSEENKEITTAAVAELVSLGYTPCGICIGK